MVGNIDITTLYAFHLLNDLFLDAPKSLVGIYTQMLVYARDPNSSLRLGLRYI